MEKHYTKFTSKKEYCKAWRNGYRAREPVSFETTETGCVVPSNRKLNSDGYYRVNQKPNGLTMYHRLVWEQANGKIPQGFEINHKCKNRACSNLEHLECIPGDTHAIISNKERYASRIENMKDVWLSTGCTGTELGSQFGVTPSTACRHIKQWKEERV